MWQAPIGSHQAIAHPLAKAHVEVELARLPTTRAAWLYDEGDQAAAGEAANMAKYASAEAAIDAVDAAVQAHGGNGMSGEYGVGTLIGAVRAARIAPVSREMILNYVRPALPRLAPTGWSSVARQVRRRYTQRSQRSHRWEARPREVRRCVSRNHRPPRASRCKDSHSNRFAFVLGEFPTRDTVLRASRSRGL